MHVSPHPRWFDHLELGKVVLQSSVSQVHLGDSSADDVLDYLNQCEKTAVYRQDVFEELTYNPQLCSTLDDMVTLMTKAIDCFGVQTRVDVQFVIRVLPLYRKILDQSVCLKLAKSEGLKTLDKFFEEARARPTATRLRKEISPDGKLTGGAMELLALAEKSQDQIFDLHDLRGQLNFYCGFSKLNQDLLAHGFDVCRPTLLPKEKRVMRVIAARHPYLARQMDEKKIKLAVPNNITHDPKSNTVVITGVANAGKTTYLRTIGVIQAMGQDGLLVPASSAEISFVDSIETFFIKGDDMSHASGMYVTELKRFEALLDKATPFSLLLLNEGIRGTDFSSAVYSTNVLMQAAYRLGAATYLSTHLHEVAARIEQPDFKGARNIHPEVRPDGSKLVYTYKMKPGPGPSLGVEIARERGLSPEDIAQRIDSRARKQGFEKYLRR